MQFGADKYVQVLLGGGGSQYDFLELYEKLFGGGAMLPSQGHKKGEHLQFTQTPHSAQRQVLIILQWHSSGERDKNTVYVWRGAASSPKLRAVGSLKVSIQIITYSRAFEQVLELLRMLPGVIDVKQEDSGFESSQFLSCLQNPCAEWPVYVKEHHSTCDRMGHNEDSTATSPVAAKISRLTKHMRLWRVGRKPDTRWSSVEIVQVRK